MLPQGQADGRYPPIQKFSTPGQVAEGPFGGLRKGKFQSNIVQVGNAAYASSTVLNDRLAGVPMGTYTRIEYLGFVEPKSGGKPYKAYDISFPNSAVPLRQSTVLFGPQGNQGFVVDATAKVPLPQYNPALPPADTSDTGDMRFTLLLSRIKLAKGESIANILKAACELSTDPYESLQGACRQMGAAELLGDDDRVPF